VRWILFQRELHRCLWRDDESALGQPIAKELDLDRPELSGALHPIHRFGIGHYDNFGHPGNTNNNFHLHSHFNVSYDYNNFNTSHDHDNLYYYDDINIGFIFLHSDIHGRPMPIRHRTMRGSDSGWSRRLS
jgi:hypothetical protein